MSIERNYNLSAGAVKNYFFSKEGFTRHASYFLCLIYTKQTFLTDEEATYMPFEECMSANSWKSLQIKNQEEMTPINSLEIYDSGS